MNKQCLFVYVLLGLLLSSNVAWAKRDVQAEIDGVRQERVRLAEVRHSLEIQLGSLGEDLRKLDVALLEARKALALASKQWKVADNKVQALVQKRKILKKQIQQLQERMQSEANAAWRRANRQPSWLDILAGVKVTEVPHRKFMVRYMLEQQQEDREQWQSALLELETVEESLQVERQRLTQLRDEKQVLQVKASKRLQAKQKMARKLRQDVKLKKKRDKALAAQENALFNLLNGLQEALLNSDKVAKHVPIRKRKGHLRWPLKGKVVASFGSRSNAQAAKLLGVQIAPSSSKKTAKQVRVMADGQVRYADWFGGFGLMMVVEYGHGIMGIYAHNDALYKQVGDWVEAGDVVAEAGSTGWIEKTRLYFELRDKGKAVNPARWCR
ncbi:MAG: peptidoglycan DD-metalloendopeptidase family protein [Mariprofundaceae bacterium]|nr:peptidoglycan DD-metalloendopeptidase family protein [Mariprofundaceae bacterium]